MKVLIVKIFCYCVNSFPTLRIFQDQEKTPIDTEIGSFEHNPHSETIHDNNDYFMEISDQLIHPNLQCKTGDAIAMILAYFLQHHLTWVALVDLLKLFHNVLGDDSNLPKTKYFFKKCFEQNQKPTFHIYCKNCKVYIDTYDGVRSRREEKNEQKDETSDVCSVCGSAYSLKKMNDGHFFIELPLREQIENKLMENPDILNYNTGSSNTTDITDIFDGALYKSLRAKVGNVPLITLTLNTDGVRVFKSKRKASLWPIQMYINEVPPNKRLKAENIILNGIWFGTDPVFEIYLKPLVEELKTLDENKILAQKPEVGNVAVTVRLLFTSADAPARCKLLKLKQYNGEFGCTYCIHPGFMVGGSTTSKYTLASETYRLRTHSSTVALMNSWLLSGDSILGIMGVSPLIGFKDYDLIRCTVIDYLHCILEGFILSIRYDLRLIYLMLGVASLQLNLWFDSKHHREPYYITPRGTEIVNKNLKSIKPLRTFSISPRTIDEKEFWKAHELKYWLLFYAVPCLTGILKPMYLDHLSLLSESLFIFLKTRITDADHKKASDNLRKFVVDFQKYYGEENMVYNVHLLEHIPKCVTDCGPLWGYSNFNFESNNGFLVKHVNGTTDVEKQISSKYAFNNALMCLKKVSEPTFNYIDRMKNMRVKNSEKIG